MKSAPQTLLAVFPLLLMVGCGDTPTAPTGGQQASDQEQKDEQPGEQGDSEAAEVQRRGDSNIVPMRPSEMTGLTPGHLMYYTWDEKPVAVVWTDAPEGGCWADDAASPKETFHGTLTYRTGKEVEYLLELEGEKKGQFTVNNEKYDLTNGAMFLLAGAGDDLKVKQLSRDIAQLKLERQELVAFAEADPDIPAFFPETVKPD